MKKMIIVVVFVICITVSACAQAGTEKTEYNPSYATPSQNGTSKTQTESNETLIQTIASDSETNETTTPADLPETEGLYFEIVDGHAIVSADDERLTEAIIPAEYMGYPVTEIPKDGFKKLEKLKTLVLPEGITKIGEAAFEGCTALTAVTLPESLTELGKNAFYGCSLLKDLQIGHNLAVLPRYCFVDCDSLTKIVIPEGVKEIDHAFGNRNLKEMTVSAYLPSSVEYMEYAFSYSTAEESIGTLELHLSDYEKWFNMPTSKTEKEAGGSTKTTFFPKQQAARIHLYIGNEPLTEAIVPDGCTEIPENCFSYITSIKSAHLPEGVVKIGKSAFKHSGLTEIIFSSTVRYVLQNAFSKTQIRELSIPGNVVWFAGCEDMPELERIKAEEGLLVFGGCVSCPKLKTVDLPSSLCSTLGNLTYFEKLDGYDPANDRDRNGGIFIDCPALESVNVPENNQYYGVIGGAFYDKIEKLLSHSNNDAIAEDPAIETIGGYTFQDHSFKNKTVVIPGNIRKICANAFAGSNVKTFVLSEGVQILDGDALNAKAPVEVVLPKSLTETCSRLFGLDNRSVGSIYFCGSEEDWQNVRIVLYSNKESTTKALTDCAADLYFYSESEPSSPGLYWHYDEKGEIEEW